MASLGAKFFCGVAPEIALDAHQTVREQVPKAWVTQVTVLAIYATIVFNGPQRLHANRTQWTL